MTNQTTQASFANTRFTAPDSTPASQRPSRRWALAVVAYVSAVSISLGAAAALVSAGMPLDALIAVI